MEARDYISIIEFAIDSENKAMEYYEQIAEKLNNAALKEMFYEFAAEEKKHGEILIAVLESDSVEMNFTESRDYKVSQVIELPEVSDDMTPSEAIAIAVKAEEAAMIRYTMLAENCNDAEGKKIFEHLAAMERGHKFKLENAFVDIAYPEVW